jgi:hypothetical protein
MDGSFLKFLTKNDRINFLQKNNCRIILNNEKKKKNNKNDILLFIATRYREIYGIDITSDILRFDQSIPLNNYIQGVDKNNFSSYKLEKTGIPLPYFVIYNIITTGKICPEFEGVSFSDIIYIFSQEKKESETVIFHQIKKEYFVFFRVLESGAMIKTSRIKPDTTSLVLHRRQNDQEMIIDLEASKKKIDVFVEKTDGFLHSFFSELSKRKEKDPKMASLSNRIFNTINNYNCMRIQSSTVSQMTSHEPKKSLTKIMKTAMMKDKSKPYQNACCITGCSMIRQKCDSKTPIMFMYLYDHVDGLKSRKNTKDKSYQLSLRLCEEHGYLIAAIWYLFNQLKIWAFDLINISNSFKTMDKAPDSVFMIYSKTLRKTNNMLREREKMDLSIAFIKQWMLNNF